MQLEPDDGEPGAVRLGSKQSVVHEDKHYPVPEQGGSVQSETGKITSRELLSGLLRRQRRQPRREIPTVEI